LNNLAQALRLCIGSITKLINSFWKPDFTAAPSERSKPGPHLANGNARIFAAIDKNVSNYGGPSFKFRSLVFHIEDLYFAKVNGFCFGSFISRLDLVSDKAKSLQYATGYAPVWSRHLRYVFDLVKKNGFIFENFIDIGSGAGKACFYAASKGSFKKIYGVEFSDPLLRSALENLKRIKSTDVVFVHADAADFLLPPQRNLIFLYNPFQSHILDKFLKNNLLHFAEHDSMIAYVTDLERQTLLDNGFTSVTRDEFYNISIFRYSTFV
jgi:16S rRNA G966 N2-methylase RsmD